MDPITITPETVTVVRLAVVLTEEQARAVLVDPAPFQARLRLALQAHGTRSPRTAGRSLSLNGRPPKEAPAKAAGKAAGGKAGFAKAPCPECGQPISKAQLSNHRAKKHGVSAAASSASA